MTRAEDLQASPVCGPLLAEMPSDEFVLRRTKLPPVARRASADLHEAVVATSIKLAVDTLWEVLEDPRAAEEGRFWFPVERPGTRRKLDEMLRDHLRAR
jgi:hypothetical protein